MNQRIVLATKFNSKPKINFKTSFAKCIIENGWSLIALSCSIKSFSFFKPQRCVRRGPVWPCCNSRDKRLIIACLLYKLKTAKKKIFPSLCFLCVCVFRMPLFFPFLRDSCSKITYSAFSSSFLLRSWSWRAPLLSSRGPTAALNPCNTLRNGWNSVPDCERRFFSLSQQSVPVSVEIR